MTPNYARSQIQPIFEGKFKFWENWGSRRQKDAAPLELRFCRVSATNIPVRWT